jgi:hypothetical protein
MLLRCNQKGPQPRVKLDCGMSTNVHYTQISDPQLLDIVDETWSRDKLPDDSKL